MGIPDCGTARTYVCLCMLCAMIVACGDGGVRCDVASLSLSRHHVQLWSGALRSLYDVSVFHLSTRIHAHEEVAAMCLLLPVTRVTYARCDGCNVSWSVRAGARAP